MNIKYYSWILIIITFVTHIFGFFGSLALTFGLCFFILGCITIIYLQHKDVDEFLTSRHPLEAPRKLGLEIVCHQKPVVLITPNIKIQTAVKSKTSRQNGQQQKHPNNSSDLRKRSLIDSGIELLFKKHGKTGKDGHFKVHDVYLESKGSSNASHSRISSEDKKWNPFENIKIYTEKKKSSNQGHDKIGGDNVQQRDDVCYEAITSKYNLSVGTDGHLLDEHGSPRKKEKATFSGQHKIDNLLHTIINYIIRDFIDSWFSSLSDNKEFSDFRVRNCIEESISNICLRAKNVHWVPLMTTKLIEDVAQHTRMYRIAQQTVNNVNSDKSKLSQGLNTLSPQRKTKKSQHKRNKSDTDLKWYQNNQPAKTVNSKINTEAGDEKTLDPEMNILDAFFDQHDLYKEECSDEHKLEKYLTQVMETVLYFTLPDEDFACLPLRTFLSTLLANAVFKPLVNILSDPDFINLQVAKLFSKEPPPAEYFIKTLRQSTNTAELKACRQLITKEITLKYNDPNAAAELQSLRYTQKLISLRMDYLKNSKDFKETEREKVDAKLPLVSLDELLFKELARSYFLDYLSMQNLQKYVIFYLTADEWKIFTTQALAELHSSKIKGSKEDVFRKVREKAQNIYKEYLDPASQNRLDVDQGLREVLYLKLQDSGITPENSWFDSLCKFVYEKLKHENIFLTKFYQSEAYRRLLLELEFVGQNPESDIELNITQVNVETGSDSNSGDINFDDGAVDPETDGAKGKISSDILQNVDLLDVANFKHTRSHSDCTGIVPSFSDTCLEIKDKEPSQNTFNDESRNYLSVNDALKRELNVDIPTEKFDRPQSAPSTQIATEACLQIKQRLTAKIINTAILCEGQYAVYAIHVSIIEDSQHKSWHIYRRYSKFLELKKILVKLYPPVSKIPFPAKKAFQNTQRAVLEHRMVLLNEFLRILCVWAEDHDDMMRAIREFLEPDTDDRKIHGGVVIRTIESLVNPLKTGMKTIRNMPDTLVGSFSKILLGKGPLKEPSFLEVNSVNLEQSSEYPALTSALHLLDEVFDLQARSQWLRRGIINRLLGAPWVSHTANKKILHVAKSVIEFDKIEHILEIILHTLWPNGKRTKKMVAREESTKLRTQVAARMALFALLSDDLKHVVGSETTRSGLLNFYSMWQHKKLNLRLILVLLNNILTTLYQVDSMTKHVND